MKKILALALSVLFVLTMFVGRIGPLTVATLWAYRYQANISYAEELVAIG